MLRTFCFSKIHRGTITSVNLDYEGSISVDADLLKAAKMSAYEQVHVLNINNGNRFVTYIIEAPAGSGQIQINGAAAHLCKQDDLAIIISYRQMSEDECKDFKPHLVYVDSQNKQTT
jgi:aspartate 1-decarboxylase